VGHNRIHVADFEPPRLLFTSVSVGATINVMATKTLKQLRELAKKAGVKGYSKLTKTDLEKMLNPRSAKAAVASKTPPAAPARTKTSAAAKPATKRPASPKTSAPAPRTPTPVDSDHVWWQPAAEAAGATTNGTEQRIESAKYASRPRGAEAPPTAVTLTDLGEDIDHLPALHRSTLVLLPQKPGVLHAYWALAADAVPAPALQLRLCRTDNGALDVFHEAAVSSARGHYYFHVPDGFAAQEAVVQLGYYHGGEFVSAVDRGVGRIPSLYASARTDRWWWISEADFQRMYLRSGGELRGRTLRWAGSIGSPAGRAQPGEEQLAWPGGVSSR